MATPCSLIARGFVPGFGEVETRLRVPCSLLLANIYKSTMIMGISILGYCLYTVQYTTKPLLYSTVQYSLENLNEYIIIIITVQYSTVSISLHCTSTEGLVETES